MDPSAIGLTENDIVELVKCYIHDKRNRVNGKFRLVSYQVQRLSEEPVGYLGDHYLLDVNLREKMVHYTIEEEEQYAEEEYISFFLKVIPEHVPKLADYIKEMGCFRKEILLYKHVIPRLQDVMIGTKAFVPTAYFTKDERLIVFENLKSEGYSIVEGTQNLLDFEHLKVALKAVAKLHASSLILEERSKTPIPKLFVGYLNENAYIDDDNHVRKINLENAIHVLCEMIKRIDKYTNSDKLEEILEKVPSVVRKIYEFSKPSTIFRNVLNHGDLWCNNVMFRYELVPTSDVSGINSEECSPDGGKPSPNHEEDCTKVEAVTDVASKHNGASNGERRRRKRSSIKKPNPYEVLNLGNWSSPNRARPTSCILIDFQIARYAPPAYDVLSLLISTTTCAFRERYLEELLDAYYDALRVELDWFHRDVREVFLDGISSYRESCDRYHLAGLIDSVLYRHVTMLPDELVARCREEHRLPGIVGIQYEPGNLATKVDICLEAWTHYEEYRNYMTDMLSDLVDQYILQNTNFIISILANNASVNLGPIDAKLVDFQLARYAPPALDVWTLIMLCSERSLRQQKIKSLLKLYYETLADLMRSGGIENVEVVLPYSEFHSSCVEFALAGLIESLLFSHITLLPKEAAKNMLNSSEDFDSFLRGNGKLRVCLRAFEDDVSYRTRISELLTELVEYHCIMNA